MINLRNSPFLWISLMLLCSYRFAAAILNDLPEQAFLLLHFLCVLCAFMAIIRFNPKQQYLSSIWIGTLIFVSGAIRLHDFTSDLYQGSLVQPAELRQGIFHVRQVLKNKGTSLSLSCRRIVVFEKDEDDLPVPDKYVLIYVSTNDPLHFLPGDIIRAEGWLSAIKAPLNPNAFDARTYYNTLGIRHQLYCKAGDVTKADTADFSIARMTAQWQSTLSNVVRKNMSPQVAQLTNALVWGDRSDMDPEVRDAFADSGAMHVLSVSGMHVAIIYSMLFFILGAPSAGIFMHRAIRFACYAFAIILYMGLTGGCPAVVRAGLMIILYLLGKSMGWNTQIWNLLGFAAFVMLWINPYISGNIGFQLSFLAMAGILLFLKPIIRSVSFRKKILQRCWEITAMSIAAQVFILPVLLRVFHQFPLTFILSSIAAAPAAYMVIFGAIVNIIFSFMGLDFLWPALDWFGNLFISIMQWMSGLNPLMYFSLPSAGSLCLMAMAVIFSIALVFKWQPGKKIAWTFGIVTFIILGCHRTSQWTSDDLVIYHSSKGLIIDIIEGGHCYSVMDCSIPPDAIDFVTRGYRCHRDIINLENICTNDDFKKKNIRFEKSNLLISGYSILIWNDSIPVISNLPPSHVIIGECRDKILLEKYIHENKALTVILPAHLDRYIKKEIKEFVSAHRVPCHDIDEMGYFKIEL